MTTAPPTASTAGIRPGARLRLDAVDEQMHELGPETNFNESMYFNVYDASQRLGGFVRLGNRANEGKAEMTVCLYLPDGRVAFAFERPAISSNDAFDAGGMRFDVVEAFKELTVAFDGEVLLLAEGQAMADPGAAYRDSPRTTASIRLRYEGVSPMLGGEPESTGDNALEDAHGGEFARGHYEQHVFATGSITVADSTWEVAGPGLRDHSWGPRHWQTPWWYRWLTGNFGRDAGFVASVIAKRDGSRALGGVVFREGAYEQVLDVQMRTVYDEASGTQGALTLTLTTPKGSYEIAGDVIGMVPLRNRRTDEDGNRLVTRIAEGLTVWTCPALSPSPGSGLSEYLDQMTDGRPVGRDEEA